MTTPASNPNESSRMKKILASDKDESVMSRLPRGNGAKPPMLPKASKPTPPPALVPVSRPVEYKKPVDEKTSAWRFKFLPAFWTIASIMSFTVNIVLLVVVILFFLNRGPVGSVSNKLINPLLGGLYNNFVLMDEANIQTNIHVEKQIPVKFDLLVTAPADVTLREDVIINNALVTVTTGGLNIVNARARIVLPAGQSLPVNISNLIVPVDQQVLAVLDVPVDIPLNQTELHQPFVGLQGVVKPWYCLMNVKELQGLCDNVANPIAPIFNIFAK